LYLSRIKIPWLKSRNPYEIHRFLWRLFPGMPREIRKTSSEDRMGFLFRIEKLTTGQPASILLQSKTKPSPAAEIIIVDCRNFDPKPEAGQKLAFLLTANPIKTITDCQKDQKPGKQSEKCRVPLLKEEEQRAWLARKLSSFAEVEACSILPHPPLYFRKGDTGGKLNAVTFEGILRVNNGSVLKRQLENGIGPAKGFGCGLMLVRRAS